MSSTHTAKQRRLQGAAQREGKQRQHGNAEPNVVVMLSENDDDSAAGLNKSATGDDHQHDHQWNHHLRVGTTTPPPPPSQKPKTSATSTSTSTAAGAFHGVAARLASRLAIDLSRLSNGPADGRDAFDETVARHEQRAYQLTAVARHTYSASPSRSRQQQQSAQLELLPSGSVSAAASLAHAFAPHAPPLARTTRVDDDGFRCGGAHLGRAKKRQQQDGHSLISRPAHLARWNASTLCDGNTNDHDEGRDDAAAVNVESLAGGASPGRILSKPSCSPAPAARTNICTQPSPADHQQQRGVKWGKSGGDYSAGKAVAAPQQQQQEQYHNNATGTGSRQTRTTLLPPGRQHAGGGGGGGSAASIRAPPATVGLLSAASLGLRPVTAPAAAATSAADGFDDDNNTTATRMAVMTTSRVDRGNTSSMAVPGGGGRLDARQLERRTRAILERMNFDTTGGASCALDDPVRNGSLLCRLVNLIIRNGLHSSNSSVGTACGSGGLNGREVQFTAHPKSMAQAQANYVNALLRLRRLGVPSGAEPIPAAHLYLDASDVLLRNATHELWLLLHRLIESYVTSSLSAKGTMKPPSSGANGGDVSGVLHGQQQLGGGGGVVPLPMESRNAPLYTNANMAVLERTVCRFLLSLRVLPDPASYNINDDLAATEPLPDPTRAPFVPEKRVKWVFRTTAFSTISLPSVLPYLCNGTALCDVVSVALGVDVPTYRNPRVKDSCLANITAALSELKKHQPHRISPFFVNNPLAIYSGDRAFVLFLLEDVMRLVNRQPPRREQPNAGESPYIPNDLELFAAPPTNRVGCGSNMPPATRGTAEGAAADEFGNVNVSHDAVLQSALAAYPQTERQPFTANKHSGGVGSGGASAVAIHQPPPAATTTFRREESVGSQLKSPFVAAGSNAAPDRITPRTTGVTNAAPSSGRSIVPSDEVPEDLLLHDAGGGGFGQEQQPQPALLPRHLDYLNAIDLIGAQGAAEVARLRDWLAFVLGDNYAFPAAAAEGSGGAMIRLRNLPTLTHPCFIFHDGLVLAELVSVLSYRNVKGLEHLEKSPKTAAARRNNIKKCLKVLADDKKVLTDAVFLEDALTAGDLRAVVLVLRELSKAYRNFLSSKPPQPQRTN